VSSSYPQFVQRYVPAETSDPMGAGLAIVLGYPIAFTPNRRLHEAFPQTTLGRRKVACAARGSVRAELAQQRSGVRDLPCLNDQAVAEVREDDLVDPESLSCSGDPREVANESARDYDASHRP
jgi:hypothetical protein